MFSIDRVKAETADNMSFRRAHLAHTLPIRLRILSDGHSKIFADWHEKAGITEDDFGAGLVWLAGDPLDDRSRFTRRLVCDFKERRLIYAGVCIDKHGLVTIVKENGEAIERSDSVETDEDAPDWFGGKMRINRYAELTPEDRI